MFHTPEYEKFQYFDWIMHEATKQTDNKPLTNDLQKGMTLKHYDIFFGLHS